MNEVIEELRSALGEAVRTETETRRQHGSDSWALADLRDFEGTAPAAPMAVVEPASAEDVATVLRICRRTRTPVVTYGGGSGVCGAVQPGANAIVLSTRGLAGLVRLEGRDLTATFRAGTMGIDAENRVQQEGLTIGHWPQSIDISTVGGWVATRAAGQFSTGYGNIEDVVLALTVVLPDGRVLKTRETPRAAAGPDLRQLFMGSEGTLGVITEVTFSLRPLPEATAGLAFHFSDLRSGLEAIRRIMAAGWRPPVVRLYDAPESQRHFGHTCPEGRALLLLRSEGAQALVDAERTAVSDLCRHADGKETDAALVEQWMGKRNHVPAFRDFIEKGIMVDTIEVAATWSRIGDVYDRVTKAIAEDPNVLVATAHSSHSYRSGTNLYFSFAVRPPKTADMGDAYLGCWQRALRAALLAGAGMAHHHGVGRIRRDFMQHELGATGVDVLRSVKRALDPEGLLNPGNLIPPADGSK